MTAPASPPRLTDEQIAELRDFARALMGSCDSEDCPCGRKERGRKIVSLIREVQSSRLAAERAEGLARALEAYQKANRIHNDSEAALHEQAEAALAAYRARTGDGGTEA